MEDEVHHFMGALVRVAVMLRGLHFDQQGNLCTGKVTPDMRGVEVAGFFGAGDKKIGGYMVKHHVRPFLQVIDVHIPDVLRSVRYSELEQYLPDEGDHMRELQEVSLGDFESRWGFSTSTNIIHVFMLLERM